MRVREGPFLLGLAALTVAPLAHARGATHTTVRIDLTTSAVVAVPSTAMPATPPPPPRAARSAATITKGDLHLRDAAGVDHAVATFDARSWLTWDVEVAGTYVFTIRTFTVGAAKDDGHDVIRASDASGRLLWARNVSGWAPKGFDVAGALAIAEQNRLELVDAATASTRCIVTLPAPAGWPVGVMPIDGGAFLYDTTAQMVAFDPATCATRWTAKSGGLQRMPLLYRGKLYDVAPSPAGTGGSVSIVERDARTGASGRTFVAATTSTFFDKAGASLVPSGDSLFADVDFIVLD